MNPEVAAKLAPITREDLAWAADRADAELLAAAKKIIIFKRPIGTICMCFDVGPEFTTKIQWIAPQVRSQI